MKHENPCAEKVVDLLRYRNQRTQGRLDFERSPDTLPALALVTPFRALSAREVNHRERMMRHLMKRV